MKAKKSKSSVQLQPAPRQLFCQIPLNELQDLYDKQADYDILQDKVNRSKPILQTIYAKIKKKQQKYQNTISNLQRKAGLQRSIVRQYKQLYEEGLRIMHRNKLVGRFKGYSNYRNPQNKKDQISSGSKIEQLKTLYRNKIKGNKNSKNCAQIKKMYQSSQRSPGTTKEEIYKRYRDKINSDSSIHLKQSSPHLKTKQKSHKLLTQFNSDLQSLTKKYPKTIDPPKESSQSQRSEGQEQKLRYLRAQRDRLADI